MVSRSMDQHAGGDGDPVRLLHMVSTFAVKTDTIWLEQLLSAMPRDAVTATVACMYEGGPMQDRFARLGVSTCNLDAPRAVSPGGLMRAWRLMRRLRPQVVHTHLLRADLYGSLAARLAGVPAILTTGYAIGDYRRARVRRLDPLLDLVCRRLATDGVAVSEAVRQDMITRGHWRPQHVSTIHTGRAFDGEPPGDDERQSARREMNLPADVPVVMTVARLSYEKGIDTLIAAADRVRQQCPDVRFVVLGDGPLRPTLAEQIAETGLEQTVQLLGFRTDVSQLLAGADLFVLPSHMEGMPNAVLEAYDAGLPVIASAAGGLLEAVVDHETGLLVPPDDAVALADAISGLLVDADHRRTLARQGRHWAKERFDLPLVAKKFVHLYRRLAGSIADE